MLVQLERIKMNNKCINCRIRTKKGIKYFFCVRRKAEIERKECEGCLYKEYKKVAKIAPKTRIRAVSKKRVFVSKKTYNQVYEECNGRCALCYSTYNLHYHHIYYRSERKDLIDDPSNGIMLCEECHRLVHSNKRKYQPILLEIKKRA